MEQRFTAKLLGRGPNTAWIFLPVPFNVAEVFGSKARVAVRGTLNGAPFRNSLLPNGDGTHSMPVNKELMASAKTSVGETVTVVMAVDKERSLEPSLRRTTSGVLFPNRVQQSWRLRSSPTPIGKSSWTGSSQRRNRKRASGAFRSPLRCLLPVCRSRAKRSVTPNS
jgi:hypothetical protein